MKAENIKFIDVMQRIVHWKTEPVVVRCHCVDSHSENVS